MRELGLNDPIEAALHEVGLCVLRVRVRVVIYRPRPVAAFSSHASS